MKIDGYDDCICGIVERYGMETVLLYHTDTIIEKIETPIASIGVIFSFTLLSIIKIFELA